MRTTTLTFTIVLRSTSFIAQCLVVTSLTHHLTIGLGLGLDTQRTTHNPQCSLDETKEIFLRKNALLQRKLVHKVEVLQQEWVDYNTLANSSKGENPLRFWSKYAKH